MERKTIKIICVMLLAASFVFLYASKASALPVLYVANNHYYEAVPGSIDWEQARINAQSSIYMNIRGHLATITSAEENNWVWANLGNPVRYYLGATDSLEEGTWRWVTGETWVFSSWIAGEPNDGFNTYPEDALSYWDNGEWNDLPMLADYWGDGIPYVHGYIIEYDPAYLIPEPSGLFLFSAGLAGLGILRRRRRKYPA